ncbi:MAG: hypothetical protein KA247_04765 [Bacteroidetes bacterium]|nr:hypothetical protein [Bacteroidota bacterium]
MKKYSLMLLRFIVPGVILIAAGCGPSIGVMESWVNPNATPASMQFTKVAVFALMANNVTARLVEDQICLQLKHAESVPSYTLFDQNDPGSKETVKAKLAEMGFDGAIVFRVVNAEQRETYTPGIYPDYYNSFYGYYNYNWDYLYAPGTRYLVHNIVNAEIKIYSVKEDKLIWTAETASVDPADIENEILDLSISVRRQLVRDGLIIEKK